MGYVQHFFRLDTIHAIAKWTRDGAPELLEIEGDAVVDNNTQKGDDNGGSKSMQISGPPSTPVAVRMGVVQGC